MKKFIGILVVVLAVSALALPAWFGTLAERQLVENMAEQSAPAQVVVDVTDYQRGWLDSTAIVEVGLSEDYADALLLAAGAGQGDASDDALAAAVRNGRLRFAVDITHGPIGAQDGVFFAMSKAVMRLQPPNEAVARWQQSAGLPYLFEARTTTGFDGVTHVDADVPAINHRVDDTHIEFSGLNVQGRYDPASRYIVGNMGIDALRISADEMTLGLESISLDGEGAMAGRYLFLGSFNVGMDRAAASGPGTAAPELEMRGFRIVSDTTRGEIETNIDTRLQYHVDALVVDAVEIENAELAFVLRNVDIDALERYAALSQQLALLEPLGNPAADEIDGLVHAFLAAGPVLELDPIAFVYDGEPFRATLRVATDASALPAADAMNAANPGLWMQLFSADAEIDIAKRLVRMLAVENMAGSVRAEMAMQGAEMTDEQVEAFAEQQADATIAQLVQQGFIVDAGDTYASRLSFENGQLTVNDQPLPLPGL